PVEEHLDDAAVLFERRKTYRHVIVSRIDLEPVDEPVGCPDRSPQPCAGTRRKVDEPRPFPPITAGGAHDAVPWCRRAMSRYAAFGIPMSGCAAITGIGGSRSERLSYRIAPPTAWKIRSSRRMNRPSERFHSLGRSGDRAVKSDGHTRHGFENG